MKLTLIYTTNRVPTDMEATLAHHNIQGMVFTRCTFPNAEYELEVADTVSIDTIKELLNPNEVRSL